MSQNHKIVFVCEHGAAKSVIAAAYFNQFARQNNMRLHAIARGTNPDAELSVKAIEGLQRDGLTPLEAVPQKLTLADLESAQQIISFCELPEKYVSQASYETWHDIPAVSENYETARDMIVAKLRAMMESPSGRQPSKTASRKDFSTFDEKEKRK